MYRPMLIAAALIAPALAAPATAQTAATGVHAENGPTSGRSPHRAYRDASARSDCGPAMHSLPSGKGYVFGRHALPGGHCAAPAVTVAQADTGQARD